MNVYDFDDTIYEGDSTVDFYKFCLKRKPFIILKFPFITGLLFITGFCRKIVFKEKFYGFLKCFDDIDSEIQAFWADNIKNIKPWYKKRQKQDDVIISASPEFLLKPACEMLGIRNIHASIVDKYTGKYSGENCWGEEKVKRYRDLYGEDVIHEFYSDSLSDAPLADISEVAYVITGENTEIWSEYKLPFLKNIRKTFFAPEFILFLIIGVVNTLNCIWISAILSKLMHPNAAFFAGYGISLVIAYLLNSVFNFHERISFVRLIKFAVSYIPNFILQNIIVFMVYNVMKFPEVVAYAVAGIIGIPVTFLCVKLFAFAKKKQEE